MGAAGFEPAQRLWPWLSTRWGFRFPTHPECMRLDSNQRRHPRWRGPKPLAFNQARPRMQNTGEGIRTPDARLAGTGLEPATFNHSVTPAAPGRGFEPRPRASGVQLSKLVPSATRPPRRECWGQDSNLRRRPCGPLSGFRGQCLRPILLGHPSVCVLSLATE